MAQNDGEIAGLWIVGGLFAIVAVVLGVDHFHKKEAPPAPAPVPVAAQPAPVRQMQAPVATNSRAAAIAAASGDPNAALPAAPTPPPEDRSYTDMRDALRAVVTSQEVYFAENATSYAGDLRQLPSVALPPDVTVQIRNAGPTGFTATAAHAKLPGKSCAVFVGNAAPSGPAKVMGQIRCTDEDE